MTAAGLVIGMLLALTLLAREVVSTLDGRDTAAWRAVRTATWVGVAAFAVITAVRLLQFIA